MARSLQPSTSKAWTVLDLFSGAGGMSYGFACRSEFRIVGAVDKEQGKPGRGVNPGTVVHCNGTYAANIGVEPLHADLHVLDPEAYRRELGLSKGELTLLIACAPCTGFSQKNALNHVVDDPRNSLVRRSGVWVRELLPEFFVMENVKELLIGRHQHHYIGLRQLLEDELGYRMSARVHNLADFGLPQNRVRALIIARRDGPVASLYRKAERGATVRDAIGDLPPIGAGEVHPDDEQHRAPAHNGHSMERIRATPRDGGSWSDVAKTHPHLLIRSMIGKRPGSFPDIYGRMWWDRPAPTITRECAHPGNGRYLHPEQDRMVSVREMSLLQGFPPDYVFTGPLPARYNQIGDAVPPLISDQVAELIVELKEDRVPFEVLGAEVFQPELPLALPG
ncbi:MAG: DNA cytosine methyltransferase [Gaiellaceae bacterium]